jgi:hypothetical protein
MKEIVLISAYTPDTPTQDNLRELIKSLKDLNYRICLMTHTSTPSDIVDRCDYYVYDKENELLYDPEIKYFYFAYLEEYKIFFKDYFAVATHMLPIFKMYLGGLAYLKSVGEEIIHMILHDNIIKNREMWDINNEILKEKDAVLYSFPRCYSEGILNCVFDIQSVNVKNIPFDLFIFSSQELKTQYKDYFKSEKFPVFERMIFDNVWSKTNYHLVELEDEKDFKTSFEVNLNTLGKGKGENTTINFFENKYYFFHNNHNEDESTNHFEIIINKNQYINRSCTHPHFIWFPLDFENIENIKIYKNNTFIKEIDLTNEEDKKWITEHSCVIKR